MAALDGFGLGWTVDDWRRAYARGLPLDDLPRWLEHLPKQDCAWITLVDAERLRAQLDRTERLAEASGGQRELLPLYGVPFAVKDNIDVHGLPTTAACPAFARNATRSATVVDRLVRAGAIVIGKTNLDQFATGLVGTRSPYGIVRNPFNPEYIGGGSSSGSASVVARGLVPFALGTDTAGSGRVPAALTNIVGLKPTRGALSTAGIVPACRTLDCASVFALCVDDAELVASIAGGYDGEDPYSRRAPTGGSSSFRKQLAIPEPLSFFGDVRAERAFRRTVEAMVADGAAVRPLDFRPFSELADMLYAGPWVAERYHVAAGLLSTDAKSVHPVVARILERGKTASALEAFRAEYRRAALARAINDALEPFDALLVPSTPTVYRVSEVEREPFETNARLGTYTNFTNLADLCALAVPGVFRDDGLPAGVTLLATAWKDAKLAALGRWIESLLQLPLGATGRRPRSGKPESGGVQVAVVGAHMTGMPLNHELLELGAVFVERALTAAEYRLYALLETVPAKPGLVRVGDGANIALEIWQLSTRAFGQLVSRIPSPLGIGRIQLSDGRSVQGFLCEAWAVEGAQDITSYGGFRAFVNGSRDLAP